MNSENYVRNVLRTDSPITPELLERLQNPQTVRLLHAAIGLSTEAAELLDMLKKHIFYGKPLDLVNAKEEVGDSMWYAGLAIDVLRTTMNDILTMNIDKLRLRYPEKFSGEQAVNRDTDAERRLLEGGVGAMRPPSRITFQGGDCVFEFTTRRSSAWLTFAAEVLHHVENYTVPQYGDAGEDEVTNWSAEDCIRAISKYVARFGRNARPGQQRLDLLKMAHFVQLAAEKLVLPPGVHSPTGPRNPPRPPNDHPRG